MSRSCEVVHLFRIWRKAKDKDGIKGWQRPKLDKRTFTLLTKSLKVTFLTCVPQILAFRYINIELQIFYTSLALSTPLKLVKICQKFKARACICRQVSCIQAGIILKSVKMECFIDNTKSVSSAIHYSLQKAQFLLRPRSMAHTVEYEWYILYDWWVIVFWLSHVKKSNFLQKISISNKISNLISEKIVVE